MERNSFTGGLIVLLIICISCAGPAMADTLEVNLTGYWKNGGDFVPAANPIQAALNAAGESSTVTIVEPVNYSQVVSFSGAVQNNLVLDLGGATLDGTAYGVPGITIEGRSGITVRNGNIYRYTIGILTSGSCTNLTFTNLTISDPSGPAIRLDGPVTTMTADRVTITNPGGYGIQKYGYGDIANLTIRNSTVTGSGTNLSQNGISLADYSDIALRNIVIENVTVANARTNGIHVSQGYNSYSTNVTVRNSTVTGCGGNGYSVQGRNSVVFENNTASGCTGWGMSLAGAAQDTPLTVSGDIRATGNGNGIYLGNFKGPAVFRGDTIRENAGFQFQLESCADITLEDAAITKPPAGTYTIGIRTTGSCTNLTFTNLTISDSSEPGIRLDGPVTTMTADRVTITNPGGYGIQKYGYGDIANLTIRNSTVTGVGSNLSQNGISLADYSDIALRTIVIENVTVANARTNGIHVSQGYNSYSTDVTVRNSTVTGCGGNGYSVQGRNSVVFENNTASGCTGWGMSLAGAAQDTPLTVSGDIRATGNGNGIYLSNLRGPAVFRGDNIHENAGFQFQLESCRDIALEDAAITKPPAGTYSIGIRTSGSCTNLTFTNLTISDPSGPGIRLDGPVTNLTADRVTITNPGGYGIQKYGYGDIANLTIRNSTVTGSGTNLSQNGISLADYSDIALRNIVIENVTVANARTNGIHVSQGYNSYSTGVTVRNSTVTGCGGNGYSVHGRNTVVFENNTAAGCTGWGMSLAGAAQDTPLTVSGDIRATGNGNGIYLSNLRGPAVFRGENIHENAGFQFQLESCADITLEDAAITKPPAGTYSIGIRTTGSCTNLTFTNLTISDSSEPGIRLDGPVTNLTADRVTITNPGGFGIQKYGYGDITNLTIRNSTVTGVGSNLSQNGISLADYSNIALRTIVIENVTVANARTNGIHIIQAYNSYSANVTLRNSTVTGCGGNGYAVQGRGSIIFDNNTARDCTSGGTYGAYLVGLDNPALAFRNNTFQANAGGLFTSGIQGNFSDSVFADTATDILASGASRVDACNSTFDRAKTIVYDSSAVNAFWYLGITVVDPGFAPVEGASVTVTNAGGATILSGTTGPDGTLPRATLLEWTKNASAAAYYTPFLLNATKPAVGTNETSLTLDRSMDVTLILSPTIPVANFTANATEGNAPLDVLFNDTSTGPDITGYQWIFSDDPLTVYTDKNLTHTFAAGGTYDVNHSATNGAGTVWLNRTRYINVTDAPPVVNFTANTTAGTAPLDVLFNDTSTGTGITGYQWIFSDDPSTVYTDRNLTHAFMNAGTYNVHHAATNGAGTVWQNMTRLVNVTNVPPSVSGFLPMSGIRGTVVSANITGTGFIPPVWSNLTRLGMENITGTVTFANTTLIQGTFSIPASAATGGWNVTVTNADGQGGALAGAFWVTDPIVPAITSISPKKKAAGSPKFTLTVNGVNFTSTSIVRWSGSNRTTKYVSPVKLTAKITAKDVKKKGTKQVTVQNPGAGGGLSNAKPFKVI